MSELLLKTSKNIAFFLLSAAIILTPIFFLPLTTDFFGLNKQILFMLLTAVSLVFWLIHSISSKTIRLTISPMLLPLFLFTLTSVISTLINKPVYTEAWLGRSSLFITLFVFYLLFTSLVKSSRQVRRLINTIIIIASFLGFLGILSVSGAFADLNWPTYLTANSFSPTGSLLILVSLLITALPLSLVLALKIRSGSSKLLYFLSSGLLISAIILVGYQLLPGQQLAAALLPKLAGWSIAIDTFKTKAIFGAGPASFLQQFNRFKPLSLNQTNLWNAAYAVSANEYLQIMTTLGLAGLITFGLTILSWLKLIKRKPGTRTTTTQMAVNLATMVVLIMALLIPLNLVIWIMFIALLALSVGLNKSKNYTKVKDVFISINALNLVEPDQATNLTAKQATGKAANILPWIMAVPLTVSLILSAVVISRSYAADYFFRKSLEAAAENRGSETYNLQIKASQIQPNVDRYRVAYSNTNLALANSIATKADLTDQDRQTIIQLIQQSVREARIATQLNPNKTNNWQNLANIYRQLVNFAQDADQFAIASYVQAIRLAPANPVLRVDLGGLLYALKNYDGAIDRFQEAVNLKPDYANGHYNLAIAYRDSAKYLQAFQAMQQAAALVPADSPDAQKVQQELADLKAKLPPQPTVEADKQPSQLSEPETPPPAPTELEKQVEVEEPETPRVEDKETTD